MSNRFLRKIIDFRNYEGLLPDANGRKWSECVQMLHLGSYDNERASFDEMEQYCRDNDIVRKYKKHREIYLSDPRKVSPEKLKTVLRFEVESK